MPEKFEKIPMDPKRLLKAGRRVFLVSKDKGTVVGVPGAKRIQALQSTRCDGDFVLLRFKAMVYDPRDGELMK